MSGLFIVFEGQDTSGKTTQASLLRDALVRMGKPVLFTREPGGCPIAEKIRELVLCDEHKQMDAVTEAYLFAAARAQHVREVIRPALEANKIVICDRFLHSSIAYQGYGRDLGAQKVAELNHWAVDGCLPSLVFFMDIPPDEAMKRKAGAEDRMEKVDGGFRARAYEGFLQLKNNTPGMVWLDARQSIQDLQSQVLTIALAHLGA